MKGSRCQRRFSRTRPQMSRMLGKNGVEFGQLPSNAFPQWSNLCNLVELGHAKGKFDRNGPASRNFEANPAGFGPISCNICPEVNLRSFQPELLRFRQRARQRLGTTVVAETCLRHGIVVRPPSVCLFFCMCLCVCPSWCTLHVVPVRGAGGLPPAPIQDDGGRLDVHRQLRRRGRPA